jgi:hypothetical protein
MIEKLEYFRDPNFKFDETAHSYTYVDPESGLLSQIFEPVSGFISQFKKPFDPSVAKYVAKSKGITESEVINEWKQSGVRGTKAHKWIEDFYNGVNPEAPEDLIVNGRVELFKQVYEEKLKKMNPIAQEFRVFSKKWGIAGTIDIIFELNKKYYVGDWKTNEDFTHDDHAKGKRNKMFSPFNNLWDNHVNSYSLQISTYRLMLEEAGFETEGGLLISLSGSGYKLHRALDLRSQLRSELEKNNFVF